MIQAKVCRTQSAWIFLEDDDIEGLSEDEVDDLIYNIAYDRYATDWDTHDCQIANKRTVEG